MKNITYFAPKGGLPLQDDPLPTRAVFTPAYAYIPRGVFTDIVTSQFPGWSRSRAWVLARPLTGFAETFAQYIMEVAPGGGSETPEPDAGAEGVLFVLKGKAKLDLEGLKHTLRPGSYVFVAPGAKWSFQAEGDAPCSFLWIRKRWEPAEGVTLPESFVTHEQEISHHEMPDTKGSWTTARFVEPDDLRHDMHVNLVSFLPGGVIPFNETHVMEHGIYVLQGTAVYRLNREDHDVRPGDFLWLRAFCPQSCRAFGTEPFRYLLYKDVNRHPSLTLP